MIIKKATAKRIANIYCPSLNMFSIFFCKISITLLEIKLYCEQKTFFSVEKY